MMAIFTTEAILAQMEPRIRRQFLRAVLAMRRVIPTDELAELLEAGRIDIIMSRLEPELVRVTEMVTAAYLASGRATADFVKEIIGSLVSFDQTNFRAVIAIQSNSLRLIRQFTTEQRNAVRAALTDGISRGLNPRRQAINFRGAIGLTERQMRSIINFRTLLEQRDRDVLNRRLRDRRFDPTVIRAIRDNTPLTVGQIDKMVDRYRQRMIRHRSEVIARTEALRSVHEGSNEMWFQAVESGRVTPASISREWVTATDERVRGSHRTMHNQIRGLQELFVSGNGNFLQYPGDPNAPADETIQCRCSLATHLIPT